MATHSLDDSIHQVDSSNEVQVLIVETRGADSLHQEAKADEPVTLQRIMSIAP